MNLFIFFKKKKNARANSAIIGVITNSQDCIMSKNHPYYNPVLSVITPSFRIFVSN